MFSKVITLRDYILFPRYKNCRITLWELETESNHMPPIQHHQSHFVFKQNNSTCLITVFIFLGSQGHFGIFQSNPCLQDEFLPSFLLILSLLTAY